jgi:class 3 adenylate cyclase
MGIATFVFTDLAGSTRLWEHSPEAMKGRGDVPRRCSAVHRGGHVVMPTGDGVHAVFPSGQSAFRPRWVPNAALHRSRGTRPSLERLRDLGRRVDDGRSVVTTADFC